MDVFTTFFILCLGLTVGFAMVLGKSSRDDVMAHWTERRCDFDVILAAHTYKPSNDPRSIFEFSGDNFKFCVSEKTKAFLMTLFGSMYEVLKKQMDATGVLNDVMQAMRGQLFNIYEPFSKLMNRFFNKFRQAGFLASRIFQHLYMSMKKTAAIALATLFRVLSLQAALLNTVDLVIKVILIFLYILIALAVIFFIPILPVMFIVYMAVNGIEAVYPGRTGDLGTVFCFASDTPVVLENKTNIPIQLLKVGSVLADGQTVEAVIELDGRAATLYSLQGIRVSGDHRVLHEGRWILVSEHPGAVPLPFNTERLWTLITSNRQIPVFVSTKEVLKFADWEELPESAAETWESIVSEMLRTEIQTPKNAPCLDRNVQVKKYQSGWVSISEIKIGDWISCDTGYTQVLGTVVRKVKGGHLRDGLRLTDGLWWKSAGKWDHPTATQDSVSWTGHQLVCDSGVFSVRFRTSERLVRDFTEVGLGRLPETYARVEMAMEKKY